MKKRPPGIIWLAIGLFGYSIAALYTLITRDMLTMIIPKFLVCGLAAVVFMTGLFFIAKHLKRFDLVDVGWGLTFIVIAVTSYLLQPASSGLWTVQTLVVVMVIIWGGRLALHIARRIKRTDHEDPRYVALRKDWKQHPLRAIFTRIYMTQAMLALIIMIPVIHICLVDHATWGGWTFAGLVVWLVGFAAESIGDRQLGRFVNNKANKGKIMTVGLWRYSRHPNYFGELTQWWGIALICLGTSYGWVGLIGPVLLSYLIIFVPGIPLNEARFAGRLGWERYKETTSVLIPWIPKKV